MQVFKNFIIYRFKQLLLLMVAAGVIFITFLPASSLAIWIFAGIWSSFLILATLIVNHTNNALQKQVAEISETLHTTMDPTVVKLMIAKKLRTENRSISIQFTDLTGFTSYAEEKSAEVVLSELNTYLSEMEIILLEYKGHIDKYMGDGIMSEFGAPNTFIKHSLLSVAAGWKMQQSMKRNNFPWQLRVGIATGVSTIGIIGTKRQAYTVFGDVVNLASRIEGLCEPGQVTIDETTYLACKEFFEFRQKSFTALNQLENEELTLAISASNAKLEKNSDNPGLMVKLAKLLLEARDTRQAVDLLSKAMALSPNNDVIKLAYADASLKHNQQSKLDVRGRKKSIHVYELTALKCPLGDFKNIPEQFYNDEKETIDGILSFPEDLTLPVECLDGSIGQARLVGIVSYLLATRLQLTLADRKDILEAGYLADIGKSIVPESILNRPGQLTDDEIKTIHLHPDESVRKLIELGCENQNLINIIAHHHESVNGSGYPRGLSGNDIPIGSRILAVAEAYVSMTSNRPYRDAWEVEPAYKEIIKYAESGKFDTEVTKALGDIVKSLESE